MNYSFYNYTIKNTLDYKDICPTQHELYLKWFNAYVILFGICIFALVLLYIFMDRRLQEEIKKNEELLKLERDFD